MTLVRIVKDWDLPDLMRQTPDRSGVWGDIIFTLEPVERCDYLIILNHARQGETVRVNCPPRNVWAIMQEPPNEVLKQMHKGIEQYSRIYTPDVDLKGKRYIHSQTALPWHVNRDYDFLVGCGVPHKGRELSWITSSLTHWKGHRARMGFLRRIRDEIEFDLFGRGFVHTFDKWDGLAPYRYSLAVENFQTPHYWTEKIADCYLSWTMPIYYGSTRITEYFPVESVVCIDINDAVAAIEKIRETIASNCWQKNLDAIAHARRLVLNKYQLFPFVAEEIKKHQRRVHFYSNRSRIVKFDGYNRILPANERENRRSLLQIINGWLKGSANNS